MSISAASGPTSILGLNISTVRSTLPILSASLGLLGIAGGLVNFASPVDGARGFGIALPSSATKTGTEPSPTELAFIRIHGIRNISGCVGLVGLCAYLRFSTLCQTSPIAATAVRKVIGITALAGCYVGFVDSWILAQFADSQGLNADAVELAQSKSKGHAILGVPTAIIAILWMLV